MGRVRTYTTIAVEASGFGLVILLIWASEYLDLPHALFGAPPTPIRLSELALEAGLTVIVGTGVMIASWRANRAIAHLERQLLICGSCRRVSAGGRWMTFERYVAQREQLETSHGVCPSCLDEQMRALDEQDAAGAVRP